MLCKTCGAEMVKGKWGRHKVKLRYCSSCGRADYLDYQTGALKIVWQGRVRIA